MTGHSGDSDGKWPAILLLCLCEVMALALWFSTAAVIPALRLEFAVDDFQASLISSSVAAGFVCGTFASAVLGLADRIDPRRFFMVAAFLAAAANAATLGLDPTGPLVPLMRFVVGVSVAGLYPVGMKLVSSWARGDMGLLVGILVGALTVGSASPHLIDALGGLDWRFTVTAASGLAVMSGLLINLFRPGPALGRAAAFHSGMILRAWTNRALRLANFGYFGHMWELYAMWAWIGLFLHGSFALDPGGDGAAVLARLATFAVIGVGAVGALSGGYFADRMGRTTLTILALIVSGGCALATGFLYGGDPWLLLAVCLVWGVAIVADSAQFSAAIIELSDPDLVGTMVTTQTCVGFLLTTLTIHLVPYLVAVAGWGVAFAFLAIGPAFGIWAMAALRRHPDAARLAGGNR